MTDQKNKKKKLTIVGRNISYTLSPTLHKLFLQYDSAIPYPYEAEDIVDEEGLWRFVTYAKKSYAGFNVTIPYKETIFAALDSVSENAFRLRNANVVEVRDGQLIGHNTDICGVKATLKRMNVDPNGKLCAVLGGTGGAGKTAACALYDMGGEVIIVSRDIEKAVEEIRLLGIKATPSDYDSLSKNIQILCNMTPVGTANKEHTPLSLAEYTELQFVFDAVYRPYYTKLMEEARLRKIPHTNGLYMLFCQGYAARRIWGEREFTEEELETIFCRFEKEYILSEAAKAIPDTICLTGFMGVGKSSVGKKLAELAGYRFVDLDEEIEKRFGEIPKLFEAHGEAGFRKLEETLLAKLPLEKTVLSLGGGTVLSEKNHAYLKKCGKTVYLQGDSETLYLRVKGTDRPLAQSQSGFHALLEEREPLYHARCDFSIPAIDGIEARALEILRRFV